MLLLLGVLLVVMLLVAVMLVDAPDQLVAKLLGCFGALRFGVLKIMAFVAHDKIPNSNRYFLMLAGKLVVADD